MTEERKPVRCGCGGEAKVQIIHWDTVEDYDDPTYLVECDECGISTNDYDTEAEAITAWNRVMGERTAKVIERDASIIDDRGYKYQRSEYLCGNCKKKVIGGDKYCPHCGARLEWK